MAGWAIGSARGGVLRFVVAVRDELHGFLRGGSGKTVLVARERPEGRIAAVLASVLLLAVAASACTGDSDDATPGLRITRADGSVIEFEKSLHAWCGLLPSESDPGRSLNVLAGDTPSGDLSDVGSYWRFSIELGKLEQTQRLLVPQVPVDTTLWVFFVYDEERDNEAAAYKEGSSGVIAVEEWGCEEGDAVTLTVNARVASEFGDGEAVQARGTVRAEIRDEPDGFSG